MGGNKNGSGQTGLDGFVFKFDDCSTCGGICCINPPQVDGPEEAERLMALGGELSCDL